MYAPNENKKPTGSNFGFMVRAPSMRDGRLFNLSSLYTSYAFTVIDADPDFVAFEQDYLAPGPDEHEDDRTMAFVATNAARERVVIDVVFKAPVSLARAQAYLDLVNERGALKIDRLVIWDGERIRSTQAYRNAETINRALQPGRYHLIDDVADAVLAAVRTEGGRTNLGWLKAQLGLGSRPEAAIFSLALSRRLRFADKNKPIDDAFVLALPEGAA